MGGEAALAGTQGAERHFRPKGAGQAGAQILSGVHCVSSQLNSCEIMEWHFVACICGRRRKDGREGGTHRGWAWEAEEPLEMLPGHFFSLLSHTGPEKKKRHLERRPKGLPGRQET